MYKIKLFNQIAEKGLNQFPTEQYQVGHKIDSPDAILLRSQSLHDLDIPDSLLAVARAGAGVNNIPVEKLGQLGIPVFNTPGANANAVKELVIAGMLLAGRRLPQALSAVQALEGDATHISQQVEKIKKQFSGFELPSRHLGVIGLGAIGVPVANVGIKLGMPVTGYDPAISVMRAWQLSAQIQQAQNLQHLLQHANIVTIHVPYSETTHHLLNADNIRLLPKGAIVLNFARDGVVDEAAILAALNNDHVAAYVTDFPSPDFLQHPKAICLPHLGASTGEAEENCAMMAARSLRSYLEFGEIHYSVNFPDVSMPYTSGTRLAMANANVPNIIGQITTTLADANLNIIDMINKSRGEIAYTLIDVESQIPESVLNTLKNIAGLMKLRIIKQ